VIMDRIGYRGWARRVRSEGRGLRRSSWSGCEYDYGRTRGEVCFGVALGRRVDFNGTSIKYK
jgi:hypothetical protein